MTTVIRAYNHAADYAAVSNLLIETYEPGDTFANWLQPRWEYMHAHEYATNLPIERFGVAEVDGAIVGIIHFEHDPAIAYLQMRPGHRKVASDLLRHGTQHLGGHSDAFGRDVIGVYINSFDKPMRDLADTHGFERCEDHSEVNSRYLLDRSIPDVPLPAGFRLQSLDDDNDFVQTDRVLWRGFGHKGEPPSSGPAAREESQLTPGFRKDLTIVAVAPDGTYGSYAGMWFVPENRVAYVEPVATDPDFRRLGLARAVVSESLRRVAELGAEVAWVGSDQPLYLNMGFASAFRMDLWVRNLD